MGDVFDGTVFWQIDFENHGRSSPTGDNRPGIDAGLGFAATLGKIDPDPQPSSTRRVSTKRDRGRNELGMISFSLTVGTARSNAIACGQTSPFARRREEEHEGTGVVSSRTHAQPDP